MPQSNIGFGGFHSAILETLQVGLEAEAPGGSSRIENQSPMPAAPSW